MGGRDQWGVWPVTGLPMAEKSVWTSYNVPSGLMVCTYVVVSVCIQFPCIHKNASHQRNNGIELNTYLSNEESCWIFLHVFLRVFTYKMQCGSVGHNYIFIIISYSHHTFCA